MGNKTNKPEQKVVIADNSMMLEWMKISFDRYKEAFDLMAK